MLCMAALLPDPVAAQGAYPSKPVKLVVGFPAGTNPDLTARELAKALGETWSQPIVVINRPGAGGVLATEFVSKEPADGQTLYLTSGSALVSAPFLYKKLGYDPLTGVTPIAMVADNSMILITSGSKGLKTFRDFLAAAKVKSEALTYGIYGTGSLSHVAMEKLQRTASIRLMQIAYGSSVPIPDVISGTVDVMWSSLQVAGLVDSGQLTALAYSGLKRNPRLPNVPTVSELGYPGFEALVWYGLVAPPGLAPEIVRKVAADVEPIVKSAAYQKRMIDLGNDSTFMGPAQFKERIQKEYASNKAFFEELKIEKQ
jgi:tripartite-type tricarboxylate transporter receptor subunit TctC